MRVTMLLGSALLLAASAFGTPAAAQPSLQDRQQAACYNDVQRLCGQYVPDAGKVERCMRPMKSRVSARCRALWNVGR